MSGTDPRFATFPPDPSVAQLRWLIEHAADGSLPLSELVVAFRDIHERLESQGWVRYASQEEARLVWDVLWALEFYSAAPEQEANPEEWNDAQALLAEVQRVAEALRRL